MSGLILLGAFLRLILLALLLVAVLAFLLLLLILLLLLLFLLLPQRVDRLLDLANRSMRQFGVRTGITILRIRPDRVSEVDERRSQRLECRLELGDRVGRRWRPSLRRRRRGLDHLDALR